MMMTRPTIIRVLVGGRTAAPQHGRRRRSCWSSRVSYQQHRNSDVSCSVVDNNTNREIRIGEIMKRSYQSSSSRSYYSTMRKNDVDDTHHAERNALLRGLSVHTVPSEMDDHPLAVYTIQPQKLQQQQQEERGDKRRRRIPVLLLHGRTWSSVPVYHLMGGGGDDDADNNYSLMEALYYGQHDNNSIIQPYAMDFRGFGGTPKDDEGYVEPLKCVTDVVSVLKWIHNKEDDEAAATAASSSSYTSCQNLHHPRPALLGWSHGALIAQIVAQRHPEFLSKLILYSSIYNPNVKYSIPPPSYSSSTSSSSENGSNSNNDSLQRRSSSRQQDQPSLTRRGHTDHDDFPLHEMTFPNEYDLAMADFTNYQSSSAVQQQQQRQYHYQQPPKSAKLFANAALICDPIKATWWNLHQLNECHPAHVTSTKTMVIVGDKDPYSDLVLQAELFTNLGTSRGSVDRVWTILANADHAIHLSEERGRFVESVQNFLQSK